MSIFEGFNARRNSIHAHSNHDVVQSLRAKIHLAEKQNKSSSLDSFDPASFGVELQTEQILINRKTRTVRRAYVVDHRYKVGWIVDCDLNVCMVCTREFNWLRHKHHCRACGSLVCNMCSPYKSKIPNLEDEEEALGSRVCKNCFGLRTDALFGKTGGASGKETRSSLGPGVMVGPDTSGYSGSHHNLNTSRNSISTMGLGGGVFGADQMSPKQLGIPRRFSYNNGGMHGTGIGNGTGMGIWGSGSSTYDKDSMSSRSSSPLSMKSTVSASAAVIGSGGNLSRSGGRRRGRPAGAGSSMHHALQYPNQQGVAGLDARKLKSDLHAENLIDELEVFERDQLPKYEESYLAMRKIMPLDLYKSTYSNLLADGLPESVAQRIWNTKILWLITMHPEDIAKVHLADFRGKYMVPNNLDIVEMRAIWYNLPTWTKGGRNGMMMMINNNNGDSDAVSVGSGRIATDPGSAIERGKIEWKAGLKAKLDDMAYRESRGTLPAHLLRNPVYQCDENLELYDPTLPTRARFDRSASYTSHAVPSPITPLEGGAGGAPAAASNATSGPFGGGNVAPLHLSTHQTEGVTRANRKRYLRALKRTNTRYNSSGIAYNATESGSGLGQDDGDVSQDFSEGWNPEEEGEKDEDEDEDDVDVDEDSFYLEEREDEEEEEEERDGFHTMSAASATADGAVDGAVGDIKRHSFSRALKFDDSGVKPPRRRQSAQKQQHAGMGAKAPPSQQRQPRHNPALGRVLDNGPAGPGGAGGMGGGGGDDCDLDDLLNTTLDHLDKVNNNAFTIDNNSNIDNHGSVSYGSVFNNTADDDVDVDIADVSMLPLPGTAMLLRRNDGKIYRDDVDSEGEEEEEEGRERGVGGSGSGALGSDSSSQRISAVSSGKGGIPERSLIISPSSIATPEVTHTPSLVDNLNKKNNNNEHVSSPLPAVSLGVGMAYSPLDATQINSKVPFCSPDLLAAARLRQYPQQQTEEQQEKEEQPQHRVGRPAMSTVTLPDMDSVAEVVARAEGVVGDFVGSPTADRNAGDPRSSSGRSGVTLRTVFFSPAEEDNDEEHKLMMAARRGGSIGMMSARIAGAGNGSGADERNALEGRGGSGKYEGAAAAAMEMGVLDVTTTERKFSGVGKAREEEEGEGEVSARTTGATVTPNDSVSVGSSSATRYIPLAAEPVLTTTAATTSAVAGEGVNKDRLNEGKQPQEGQVSSAVASAEFGVNTEGDAVDQFAREEETRQGTNHNLQNEIDLDLDLDLDLSDEPSIEFHTEQFEDSAEFIHIDTTQSPVLLKQHQQIQEQPLQDVYEGLKTPVPTTGVHKLSADAAGCDTGVSSMSGVTHSTANSSSASSSCSLTVVAESRHHKQQQQQRGLSDSMATTPYTPEELLQRERARARGGRGKAGGVGEWGEAFETPFTIDSQQKRVINSSKKFGFTLRSEDFESEHELAEDEETEEVGVDKEGEIEGKGKEKGKGVKERLNGAGGQERGIGTSDDDGTEEGTEDDFDYDTADEGGDGVVVVGDGANTSGGAASKGSENPAPISIVGQHHKHPQSHHHNHSHSQNRHKQPEQPQLRGKVDGVEKRSKNVRLKDVHTPNPAILGYLHPDYAAVKERDEEEERNEGSGNDAPSTPLAASSTTQPGTLSSAVSGPSAVGAPTVASRGSAHSVCTRAAEENATGRLAAKVVVKEAEMNDKTTSISISTTTTATHSSSNISTAGTSTPTATVAVVAAGVGAGAGAGALRTTSTTTAKKPLIRLVPSEKKLSQSLTRSSAKHANDQFASSITDVSDFNFSPPPAPIPTLLSSSVHSSSMPHALSLQSSDNSSSKNTDTTKGGGSGESFALSSFAATTVAAAVTAQPSAQIQARTLALAQQAPVAAKRFPTEDFQHAIVDGDARVAHSLLMQHTMQRRMQLLQSLKDDDDDEMLMNERTCEAIAQDLPAEVVAQLLLSCCERVDLLAEPVDTVSLLLDDLEAVPDQATDALTGNTALISICIGIEATLQRQQTHLQVLKRFEAVGRMLIRKGASVFLTNQAGDSALLLALRGSVTAAPKWSWLMDEFKRCGREDALLANSAKTSEKTRYVHNLIKTGHSSKASAILKAGHVQISAAEATELMAQCTGNFDNMKEPIETFELLESLGAHL